MSHGGRRLDAALEPNDWEKKQWVLRREMVITMQLLLPYTNSCCSEGGGCGRGKHVVPVSWVLMLVNKIGYLNPRRLINQDFSPTFSSNITEDQDPLHKYTLLVHGGYSNMYAVSNFPSGAESVGMRRALLSLIRNAGEDRGVLHFLGTIQQLDFTCVLTPDSRLQPFGKEYLWWLATSKETKSELAVILEQGTGKIKKDFELLNVENFHNISNREDRLHLYNFVHLKWLRKFPGLDLWSSIYRCFLNDSLDIVRHHFLDDYSPFWLDDNDKIDAWECSVRKKISEVFVEDPFWLLDFKRASFLMKMIDAKELWGVNDWEPLLLDGGSVAKNYPYYERLMTSMTHFSLLVACLLLADVPLPPEDLYMRPKQLVLDIFSPTACEQLRVDAKLRFVSLGVSTKLKMTSYTRSPWNFWKHRPLSGAGDAHLVALWCGLGLQYAHEKEFVDKINKESADMNPGVDLVTKQSRSAEEALDSGLEASCRSMGKRSAAVECLQIFVMYGANVHRARVNSGTQSFAEWVADPHTQLDADVKKVVALLARRQGGKS